MQMWLTDPTSIDKLHAIKKLQDETRKQRKRTYDESYSGKSSPSDISDILSNPGGYQNCSADEDSSKKMRNDSCSTTALHANGASVASGGGGAGLDLSFKRDDDDLADDRMSEHFF